MTELCFLAAIQFPFDSVEWNDDRAYCVCGIGSAAMAAIAFGLTCALTSFEPIIISGIGAVLGYVSIHARLLFIRLQDRQRRRELQETEATIRGPALSYPSNFVLPLSECHHIISDEEEEEEYESVF
jgi:hypothetical protein